MLANMYHARKCMLTSTALRCGVPLAPTPGCSTIRGGKLAAPPCSAGAAAPATGLSGTPATSPAPMLATSRLGLGLRFGDLAAAGGGPAIAVAPAAAEASRLSGGASMRPAQRTISRCARGRSPWLSAHAPGLGLGPAAGSASGAWASLAAGASCSAACRYTCTLRQVLGTCAAEDAY